MIYIEAPQNYIGDKEAIYLAGVTTGFPDWRSDAVSLLTDVDVAVLNPRRKSYTFGDSAEYEQQVGWTQRHLRIASVVLFYFPSAADGRGDYPGPAYELGQCLERRVRVALGARGAYEHRLSIVHQISAAWRAGHRYPRHVFNTLHETVTEAVTLLSTETAVMSR